MAEKVYSSEPLEAIKYMPLPTGEADVRLRRNIGQAQTEDGAVWEADEVYFRASITLDEVESRFGELWDNPPGAEDDEEAYGALLTKICGLDESVTVLDAEYDCAAKTARITLEAHFEEGGHHEGIS